MGDHSSSMEEFMSIPDLRNQRMKEEFINKYYLAVYDYEDNYITQYDDFNTATNELKLTFKNLIKNLKLEEYLILDNKKVRLYLMEKFNIDEEYKRCTN